MLSLLDPATYQYLFEKQANTYYMVPWNSVA